MPPIDVKWYICHLLPFSLFFNYKIIFGSFGCDRQFVTFVMFSKSEGLIECGYFHVICFLLDVDFSLHSRYCMLICHGK